MTRVLIKFIKDQLKCMTLNVFKYLKFKMFKVIGLKCKNKEHNLDILNFNSSG